MIQEGMGYGSQALEYNDDYDDQVGVGICVLYTLILYMLLPTSLYPNHSNNDDYDDQVGGCMYFNYYYISSYNALSQQSITPFTIQFIKQSINGDFDDQVGGCMRVYLYTIYLHITHPI